MDRPSTTDDVHVVGRQRQADAVIGKVNLARAWRLPASLSKEKPRLEAVVDAKASHLLK
jgi:hypothetical protein